MYQDEVKAIPIKLHSKLSSLNLHYKEHQARKLVDKAIKFNNDNNNNKSTLSLKSLINSSKKGRNKHPINLKNLCPHGINNSTVSMRYNLQNVTKTIDEQFFQPDSNSKKQKNKSLSLPKVTSHNNNPAFLRSTSRMIQEFNNKNHIVNRKEANILRKIYNEDQDFIERMNKIKCNNSLALRHNFSSEWYQNLLVSIIE